MVRTAQEFRKRFYFPGFVEYFVQMIKNCLTCIQQNAISNKALRNFLQPRSSLQSFPGDLLQIDIVGPLPSTLYKYVLTGIDVFSKYLFALSLTKISATVIAIELTKIFFQYSYIPHAIISDLGTNVVADVHEIAKLLEMKIGHATLKHAESVGVVEHLSAFLSWTQTSGGPIGTSMYLSLLKFTTPHTIRQLDVLQRQYSMEENQ